ncbi:hypothetical protein BC835DRAFT_1519096 [Cytidiella melzeri]|nr:hypothetical protein BC835DRAFT_1519096 [Cytidiella melzeri]
MGTAQSSKPATLVGLAIKDQLSIDGFTNLIAGLPQATATLTVLEKNNIIAAQQDYFYAYRKWWRALPEEERKHSICFWGFAIGVQLHAHGSGKHWQERSGSIVLAPENPSKRASKMRTAIVNSNCSNVLDRDELK